MSDPFNLTQLLGRTAEAGIDSLADDELIQCQWLGLYPLRHEKEKVMLRTKQPNGFISPEQIDVLSEILEQIRRDFIDITVRQEIQIYGIHFKDIAETILKLNNAGISTKGSGGHTVRNITGCPAVGVAKDELVDTSAVINELNDYFSINPEFLTLPSKCNIGVTSCSAQCIHPEIQCISFVAVRKESSEDSEIGFDVRLGGLLSQEESFIAQRLGIFITKEEILEVTRNIIEIWNASPEYKENLNRAQLAFLIRDWGVKRFRESLETRLGRPFQEAPGGAHTASYYFDHIGVRAQEQPGFYSIGIPVLAGRIMVEQIKKIADLARRYSDGHSIRLTTRQNIILANIRETQVEKVLSALRDVGLSINVHPIRRGFVTCTGSQFCKKAITETKARSRAIVEYLEKRVILDESIRIHLSGCSGDCAQFQIADIGLSGCKATVDGQLLDAYDIYLGTRRQTEMFFNHLVMREVPATECAKTLEQLFIGYKRKRKENETFSDWVLRAGDERIVKLLTEGNRHLIAEAHEVVATEGQE